MLVARHVTDRDQLVREPPFGVGGSPASLRLQGERVLLLARDAVALGHVLARLAHRLEREHRLEPRVREAPAERRVPGRRIPARERPLRLGQHERRARHRLDPARDEQVAVAGLNRVARADDRREPRGAKTVDGHAGDRLGQPGEQRGHPRDVAIVLTGLVGRAEPDVLDLPRGHAGTRDRLADHERREVVRALARERAAVAPDRRSHRREDDCAGHAASLFHAQALRSAAARAARQRRRRPTMRRPRRPTR